MPAESPVQTDEDHRRWADEHLVYEANNLVAAALAIPDLEVETCELAFAIESWAVHARCLLEFLWRDRDRHPGDAFATDFCKPGEWREARGKVPPTLRQMVDEQRIGREIAHLTYHRAAVEPESKSWMIGKASIEILVQLDRFAATARTERLGEKARTHLRALRRRHVEDSPATPPTTELGAITGATGPIIGIETTGGTIPYEGFDGTDP